MPNLSPINAAIWISRPFIVLDLGHVILVVGVGIVFIGRTVIEMSLVRVNLTTIFTLKITT